jgi:hypothetical protein
MLLTTKHHLSYRHVPTFSQDTIRKFSTNTSEMKRLAARNFEDILQVRLLLAPPSAYSES